MKTGAKIKSEKNICYINIHKISLYIDMQISVSIWIYLHKKVRRTLKTPKPQIRGRKAENKDVHLWIFMSTL